jgi:hypothetical protein
MGGCANNCTMYDRSGACVKLLSISLLAVL